jgi:hypothetical protein
MFQRILLGGTHVATLVRSSFSPKPIEFVTEKHEPQQLGFMRRPEGYRVPLHKHRRIERKIDKVQEVLIVKWGLVQVDLFDDTLSEHAQVIIGPGDVLLLADGAHAVTFLEDSELIEVKQGPYMEQDDKIQIPETLVVMSAGPARMRAVGGA